MKPLELAISGFGPFKGEVIVPFEKIGESGLFLISGDTGAGKTTIFDAIAFALFGCAIGENRAPEIHYTKGRKNVEMDLRRKSQMQL